MEIFDTTLRDGAQTEGVSFRYPTFAIVEALDEFRVDY